MNAYRDYFNYKMQSYTKPPLQMLIEGLWGEGMLTEIKSIHCHFSGGGNGGGIDSIKAYTTDAWDDTVELSYDTYRLVEDQFWRIMIDIYGSVTGDISVDGTIVFTSPREEYPKGLIEADVSYEGPYSEGGEFDMTTLYVETEVKP